MSFSQQRPIIGGQPVENHDYPFAVYLSIETQPSWHAVCGGTLLSPKHIVTAGHCLYHAPSAQSIKVGYGHTHTNKQKAAKALKYTIHPLFNPRTLFNDIAIIELAEPIKSTEVAHRIPVYFGPVEPGLTVTTMGWGITSNSPGAKTVPIMHRVDLTVAPTNKCMNVDGTFTSSNGPFICTGTMPGGRDECNGDSGSPAVVTFDNGRALRKGVRMRAGLRAGMGGDVRLVALTSYGDNINHDVRPACGDPNGFGFSTHIGHYEAFLTNVTGMTRQQLEQPVILDRQVAVQKSGAASAAVNAHSGMLIMILLLFIFNFR